MANSRCIPTSNVTSKSINTEAPVVSTTNRTDLCANIRCRNGATCDPNSGLCLLPSMDRLVRTTGKNYAVEGRTMTFTKKYIQRWCNIWQSICLVKWDHNNDYITQMRQHSLLGCAEVRWWSVCHAQVSDILIFPIRELSNISYFCTLIHQRLNLVCATWTLLISSSSGESIMLLLQMFQRQLSHGHRLLSRDWPVRVLHLPR